MQECLIREEQRSPSTLLRGVSPADFLRERETPRPLQPRIEERQAPSIYRLEVKFDEPYNLERASGGISETTRLKTHCTALLNRRITLLASAHFEDQRSSLDAQSVAGLRMGVGEFIRYQLPSLSAEPAGHVIGTWRDGRESLVVRFVNRSTAHWTLTSVDRTSGAVRRAWGTASLVDLFANSLTAQRIAKNHRP